MKVFITFLFIVSSVYGSAIHEYAAPATVVNEARVTTGVSSQSRAQDNQGNYAFAYKEDHAEGGTFRKEEGNALGQVIGSYGLRDADGRVRIVNYVADDLHGFRASIATNEPGTAAQPAAATAISSPHQVAVAPVAVPVEPAVVDVHTAPATQVVSEPLVAAPHQVVSEPLVAQHQVAASHQVVSEPLVAAPQQVVANNYAYAPANVVEAPPQLIKTYATSIYGPSLLTDNVIFPRQIATHVAQPAVSYQPPLNGPATYIPQALQTHDGSGYYEPTLVYSNPSGIGYSLGTNVGQFGYQLTYRKKKK